MKHGEGSGYEQLKRGKTLEEILETAMGFERTARDYYSALAQRAQQPLKSLAEELAEEESRHYELFRKLREREDLKDQVGELVKVPASDHKFSDYVQLPEPDAHPDDQSVLQYAMGREQAAMEQYSALAGEVAPGPVRDLFAWLAKEELAHKGELEKQYYELVYSTNV